MPDCFRCGIAIRFDYERSDNNKPYTIMEVDREIPHRCKPGPQPVSVNERWNNLVLEKSQHQLAHDIINAAVKAGINPFNIRTERKGDLIFIH